LINASEPTIRKIHFPQERSVGSFRLIPGVNKWREYLLSDPVVFDAKGEVVVDDETSLLLIVNEESVDDLSWMDQLGPRDIQSLDVSGSRITDIQLGHLANLKDLKTLELSHTKVTVGGMGNLKTLSNLHTLSLLTSVEA
jgi:Leucine-rich repeat (LRR) protein